MKLNSTTRFDKDYLILRRLLLQGKSSPVFAKNWIAQRGKETADRAALEADHYVKKHAILRKHKNEEENWKDEIVKMNNQKDEL